MKLEELIQAYTLKPGKAAREIFSILQKQQDLGNLLSFPTLVVERPNPSHDWSRAGDYTAADSAIRWFRSKGLAADRTWSRGYGGYLRLLNELLSPPPWIQVRMEDMEGQLSPERAKELRSLALQYDEDGKEALLTRFRSYSESQSIRLRECVKELGIEQGGDHELEEPLDREEQKLASEYHHANMELLFKEVLALGASLGEELDNISDIATFYDEFTPYPGAPDLLLWHPDGIPGGWFFSEVKGPGDSLQDTQKAWIRRNWDTLKGHFLLTVLE